MSTTDTAGLPDFAPVPRSALGPALNEQGYSVGRVERNCYTRRRHAVWLPGRRLLFGIARRKTDAAPATRGQPELEIDV